MDREGGKIRTIVYTSVVADLFHYGHLKLLLSSKEQGDYLICGVLSDEAVETYRSRAIANFDERLAVISSIKFVDRVVLQKEKDPTENLKEIHKEFPYAEIVLVHGNDWKVVPGAEYVTALGGRVYQPEYYKKLSDDLIRKKMISSKLADFESFTEHFRVDGITYFQQGGSSRLISTKANTLKYLGPLLRQSRIEKMFIFKVGDWKNNSETVIRQIQSEFKNKVVVRSSATNEDTENYSMAGSYHSELNVDTNNGNHIRSAVEKVIESYARSSWDFDYNQVLVQAQTEAVILSGVIFTCRPENCSPYYVINFDDKSGRTDTVTSGRHTQHLEILHSMEARKCPAPWDKVISAVKEIEDLIPHTYLDIEFAMDSSGKVVLYQVRPLVVANHIDREKRADKGKCLQMVSSLKEKLREHSGLVADESGNRTGLSDMAFWNPAEIIGEHGQRLSYTIYKKLITDGPWNDGLVPLGYTELRQKSLMVNFGGKAYIDLRKAFNSLCLSSMPRHIKDKLVEGSLNRVERYPHLHDKIEFQVLDSSFVFGMSGLFPLYQDYGLNRGEFDFFCNSLRMFTLDVINRFPKILREDYEIIGRLNRTRDETNSGMLANTFGPLEKFKRGLSLLHECSLEATAAFARQARLAFIGKALLLGLKRTEVLSEEDYGLFFAGLNTVASEFSCDYEHFIEGRMGKDEFFQRYGHLRPNTYDINSLRYDQSPHLFAGTEDELIMARKSKLPKRPFQYNRARLEQELAQHQFNVSPEELFSFIKLSLEAREKVKFEFTKNVSMALELFASGGEELGLGREDLAHVELGHLEQSVSMNDQMEAKILLKSESLKGEQTAKLTKEITLPSLIFDEDNLEFILQIKNRPNFITQKNVKGEVVYLNRQNEGDSVSLSGRIVLIDNADPGYDWIFTKNILGLVTLFGGVASHMAIRCAEFALPAAIGCGEALFQVLKRSKMVQMDCEKKEVKPLSSPMGLVT